MADLGSHTQLTGDEQEPFHMTPELAKRLFKERRKWKWQERIRKWETSNPFYWVIDPRPADYPHDFFGMATTSAQLKRARIRSWFSWPNLGRLAEKEIFGAGLGAVMLVPAAAGLLDIIERYVMKLLPISPSLSLPDQAVVLFFSGLCFVIGNALYYFRCPAIIQIATSHSDNSPRSPMFNRIVVSEAAFLLSHYVHVTFITARELRLPDSVTNLKGHEREMCEYYLKEGAALPRIGFGGYGMYLAERFLLTSAASRGGRLFVKQEVKRPWEEVEEASVMMGGEFSLYNGLLHHPRHTMKEVGGGTEEDIFLEWLLADVGNLTEMEKGRRVKYIDRVFQNFDLKYFDGCDFVEMSNLLAEWQYYLRPVSRVLVGLSFMSALVLLAFFLFLQTANVLRML
jgi:hypothetical protein